MIDLLPRGPLLGAFLLSSLVLAVTPGPGVLYIVTRSLLQGWRHGIASVAGVAAGNFGNAIAASIGLAALFTISSFAFTVVKYAGAAYLLYLGIRTLRTRSAHATGTVAPAAAGKVFRDGFIVALLNPKTTLFFAAFLPQFMTPGMDHMRQGIFLGLVFVGIAACTDSVYAVGAGFVAPRLAKLRAGASLGRYVSGSAFIGLGLMAAMSDARPRA